MFHRIMSIKKELTSDVKSKHQEQKFNPAKKIRLLSYNLPCFPTVCCINPNSHVLPESNQIRVEQFLDKILSLKDNQYDVICLQEIWHAKIADFLQEKLKIKYPFQLRAPNVHSYVPIVTSGLLVFSKRKILEYKFEVFNNPMLGEETLGQKGYFAFKIADPIDPKIFDTIIATHLHADGGLWMRASELWGGTSKSRRDAQMHAIHKGTDKWAKQPPCSAPKMISRHTIIMGDMNTELDCKIMGDKVDGKKWLGMNRDGRIDSKGQNLLLREYEPNIPDNYVNIFEGVSQKRVDTSDLLAIAQKTKFFGSYNKGKNATQQTGLQCDFVALRKDGPKLGELKTHMVMFDSDGVVVSDHVGIEAELDMSISFVQRISI